VADRMPTTELSNCWQKKSRKSERSSTKQKKASASACACPPLTCTVQYSTVCQYSTVHLGTPVT